jgi:tetratricopeptide (TPR) repeat protein
MTPTTLDTQILELVKKAVAPGVVRGMMNALKRAERVERLVLRMADEAPRTTPLLSSTEALDQLIGACHQDLGEEDTLLLVLDIASVFKSFGDLNRADDLYTMVAVQAEASRLPLIQGEAHLRLGETYARQGRWRDAAADLRRSRQLFAAADNSDAVGRIDNLLGTIAVEQGNMRKARSLFERALGAFQRSQQNSMRGMVLMNLGIVHNILGQFDDALQYYAQAQPYFEEANDHTRLACLYHNVGMSHLSRSSLSNAQRAFDQALTLATGLGHMDAMGLANLGLATTSFKQHDMKHALHHINLAMEQFVAVNDRLSVADAYKVKGMIYRSLKHYDRAESYLASSLRINLAMKNQLNAGETYFEMGILAKERGNLDEARAEFNKAASCFTKVGARVEIARTTDALHQMAKA